MKPLVILREDDANATTKAEDLERIYGTLIASGIPINVAIIPSVYCATKLPQGHPLLPSEKYFPYIHSFKGRNTHLNINTNKKLISFIQERNFEILQHGYSHERIDGSPEFGIKDPVQLENRILEGKRILHEVFEKEPSFFVAPHEELSREALKVVSRHFLGTFVPDLSWRVRAPSGIAYNLRLASGRAILPFSYLPSFVTEKTMHRGYYLFKNSFLVLETRWLYLLPYYPFSRISKLIKKLMMHSKIIIIVNHYWQYSLNGNTLESWQEIIDFLIKNNCHFTSCSNLYRKLLNI